MIDDKDSSLIIITLTYFVIIDIMIVIEDPSSLMDPAIKIFFF